MHRFVPFALLLIFPLVGSCASDPGAPVDDPRGYLVEALRGAEMTGWWAEYADRDEDFLRVVVDDFAESVHGGLPNQSGQLDRLQRRLLGRYRSMLLSKEHRERILRAAEERFADPPMAIVKDRVQVALLDYHELPGTWGSSGRGSGSGASEVLKDSPAIAGLGYFDHEVFIAALNTLVERFPDQSRYQVRARYRFGASPHRLTMQVDRGGPILRRAGNRNWFTLEAIDWDALLAGEVRMQELSWHQDMEGRPGPSFTNAHPQPLPLEH